MSLQQLDGSRPAQQLTHVDLTVPWGERTGAVSRALALGATHRWDVLTEHAHVQWTTSADPGSRVAEHPPPNPDGTASPGEGQPALG